MPAYDINVYQSEALTQHCSETYGATERWRSARRIADHFQRAVTTPTAAFDGDVDVTVVTEPVPTPLEDTESELTTVADSTTAPNPPCGGSGVVHYDHLLAWWRAYGRCQLAAPADDSNLLVTLTDHDDGGRAWIGGDPYATARVGKFCAEMADPNRYAREPYYYGDGGGDGDEHFATNTAIHEIGHNLVRNVENPDGLTDTCSDHFSAHHRMGTVYEERGLGGPTDVTITDSPMSHGEYRECMRYDDGANVCSNDVEFDPRAVAQHDFRYSPCTVANLQEPAAARQEPASPLETAVSADAAAADGPETASEGDGAVVSDSDEAVAAENGGAAADGEAAAEKDGAAADGEAAAEKDGEVPSDASPVTESDVPRRSLVGASSGALTSVAASGGATAPDADRPDGGRTDGGDDREPDVRIVDSSASPAPVLVSVEYVGERRAGGSVQQVEVVTKGANHPDLASVPPADRTASAVETVERLRTSVHGLHEVEVRHRGHAATTRVNVGADGAADEETVDAEIRPDGSVAVGTAVRCEAPRQ